jgi:hypothetical protein
MTAFFVLDSQTMYRMDETDDIALLLVVYKDYFATLVTVPLTPTKKFSTLFKVCYKKRLPLLFFRLFLYQPSITLLQIPDKHLYAVLSEVQQRHNFEEKQHRETSIYPVEVTRQSKKVERNDQKRRRKKELT